MNRTNNLHFASSKGLSLLVAKMNPRRDLDRLFFSSFCRCIHHLCSYRPITINRGFGNGKMSTSTAASVGGHNLSGTALLIAHHRAMATKDPKLRRICYDPWAHIFSGQGGTEFAHAQQTTAGDVMPDFGIWVAARTAFFDSCARCAAMSGYRQVVLLGAGFDTRSNRLGLANHVTFFEVDAPGPQRSKRALAKTREMKEGGFREDCSVYVECDFESQCFMERLTSAGFDPSLPALVIVEGVIYYLSEAAFTSMLQKVATHCHPHTVITFDYFSKQSIQNKKNAHGNAFLKDKGEPFLIGINHVLPYLVNAGFKKVVHHDFDEVTLAATGSHNIKRMYRFQGICVACLSADAATMPIGGVIDRLPMAKL